MDVKQERTDEFITELDKTIQRDNLDKETLELIKELLKGAKAKAKSKEETANDANDSSRS